MRQTVLRTSFLALALLLSACSSGPQPQPQTQTYQEPVFTAERLVPEGFVPASAVYDPWEGMNKRIYNFNYHFDQKVFLPVVRGYNFILPGFARTGVHNFFNNFRDVRTMVNSILQLAPSKLFQSTGRVLVNSTVGLLGLIDVATKLDFPRPQEDFGQTLGHWGVGQGPYLVIPFVGPSNLRDGAGLLPDFYVQSLLREEVFSDSLQIPVMLLDSIDTRANVPFRYYETGSAFEYQMVRWLYSTKRKLDVAK
jgi:phospholipid-binding lipoprotein MlaA